MNKAAETRLQNFVKIKLMPQKELRAKSEGQQYRRLTRRNTLFTLLVFITPFILLLIFINFSLSKIIQKQSFNQLATMVEENAKIINLFLHDKEVDFRSYQQSQINSLTEVELLRPAFQQLIKNKPWYDLFFIANFEGLIVFSTNNRLLNESIASRPYFLASREGHFFNSSIFYSDLLQQPALIFSQPLLSSSGEAIGVMGASLKLKSFYDLLFDLRIGETSELFLINSDGLLLSPTKLGGRPLQDFGFYQPQGNPHRGERGVIVHLDYRGQKVLCAYEKIPSTDMILVSEVDLKEALLPVTRANRTIILIFAIFFVVLTTLSHFHSKRTTSIIKRLTEGLRLALDEAEKKGKALDNLNIELAKKVKETEMLAEELRFSKEYVLQLIDSLTPGVIGLDIHGKITHFNRSFKRMFDLPKIQVGDNFFGSISWFNDPELELAFEKTIMTGQTHHIERKTFSTRPDEYYRLSLFPIFDGQGNIQGVSLLTENITEREKLQQQLAEYEKLSALSQLALGAAHEINNPLQGISSYLEALAEQTTNEKERDEINLVLENVARISETIRGLLNFARPSPPQFTKLNLNHLIEDTLTFLSYQPIFRKIKIEKILAPALPQITADLNQIRQVLTNIFINAAQAMPEGGELKVVTSKVKFREFVQIDISDTGCGIPPENLKRIFEPFFTTKKKQGTGLGLSISLSYIRNHGGEINVQSVVGQGTTFTILLPIRQTGRTVFQEEESIS